MRITNNMISQNSMRNINSNKLNVDFLNTQMTTQKKISRPSEDPVVAIRALRLRGNLNELNQYYEKNIPDAESWMEITETALINMGDILKEVYKQCNNGANDTLTPEDRQAILKNLQSLRQQIYEEGNATFADRSVFTGHKTNSKLTFLEDDPLTEYRITENFSFKDIEEKRYYSGQVDVPVDSTSLAGTVPTPQEQLNYRIRLSYEEINKATAGQISFTEKSGTPYTPAGGFRSISYSDFKDIDNFQVADNEVVFIEETGELIFGKDVAADLKATEATISFEYEKTGFKAGEVRPEHYFDCTKDISSPNPITFTKENQEISYTVSFNQTLVVNTQASDVFDTSIGRDIDELTAAVEGAIAAHEKVEQIKAMMKESQYSSDADQEKLKEWLDAAQKEADYFDDNMQKLYGSGVGKFQQYLNKVTLATTDLGSRASRLELTKTRMAAQQTAFEKLKSDNEDKELSDIIIEFTAAYTAYQASTMAASKAGQQTLLNYI